MLVATVFCIPDVDETGESPGPTYTYGTFDTQEDLDIWWADYEAMAEASADPRDTREWHMEAAELLNPDSIYEGVEDDSDPADDLAGLMDNTTITDDFQQ